MQQLVKRGTLRPGEEAWDAQQTVNHLMGVRKVLLCDVSSSMLTRDAGPSGEKVRWDMLVEVLCDLVQAGGDEFAIVAFNEDVSLATVELPPASGLTDIGLALTYVLDYSEELERVVLLSDGQPTVGEPTPKKAALAAARQLRCPLDVIYIGGSLSGRGFLQELAQKGGGEYQDVDLHAARNMLAVVLRQELLEDGGGGG